MNKRLIGVLATLAVVAAMLAATATVAGATVVSRPGVAIACTNSQTGRQILDLTLPTTRIAVGSYTMGKISCTVTAATWTPGVSSGRLTVHVTCVNTVTGNTIVDRNIRTAGIHAGVYNLGKVSCTITEVV